MHDVLCWCRPCRNRRLPDTKLITGELALDDGATEQVIAVIELPVRDAAADMFACKVCIPKLFDSEKWVVDAQAAQARERAVAFVAAAFEQHGVRVVWQSPG